VDEMKSDTAMFSMEVAKRKSSKQKVDYRSGRYRSIFIKDCLWLPFTLLFNLWSESHPSFQSPYLSTFLGAPESIPSLVESIPGLQIRARLVGNKKTTFLLGLIMSTCKKAQQLETSWLAYDMLPEALDLLKVDFTFISAACMLQLEQLLHEFPALILSRIESRTATDLS
jgi:hypothetical protein